MAVLYDCEDKSTYVEISFIYQIPGEWEGCNFYLRYFKHSTLIREVTVGWTNKVVKLLLNLLSKFPIPEYEGYFSHYEKHLELKWIYESATDQYLLIFLDLGTVFPLKVTKDNLKQFGLDIENEFEAAPKR